MNSAQEGGLRRRVGLRSATALVVANIIGAGIFTTTGFQAADLGHPGYILLLWIVGGALALCGALCYGELGAALPRAGGEYVYLRESYGAGLAFMSAFVSLVAGFSAPIAAAAKSLVRYSTQLVPSLVPDRVLWRGLSVGDAVAIGVVWLLVAIHLAGVRRGFDLSDLMTLMKVVGIMIFVAAAFVWGSGTLSGLFTVTPVFDLVRAEGRLPQSLATSLVFVMFCYSGWNASAYIASEMKQPRRDLPRSLVLGTLLVLALYLGLNAVFFYAVGAAGLAGEVEVGLIAGRALFGDFGASLVAVVICVSILASVSAMTIAGPRVYFAFGRDFPPLRALGRVGRTSAPTLALLLQGLVTSILILSGRVDQIQQYAGFTLSLFASLAVSCVIVLRIRRPELRRPFRVPAYPLPPILFLSVSLWMMLWAYRARPLESTLAVLTAVVGGVIFLLLSRWQSRLSLAETKDNGE